MQALMVQVSVRAVWREEGTLARRYTGGDDLIVVVVDVDLLLEAAVVPEPPLLDLEAAFAASFWAFLASFFNSFLEGPFFSSDELMVDGLCCVV